MNNDDREKNEKVGGASPTHHASSGDNRLAPVITLHHRPDNHDTDTEAPVVVEGEIVDQTCGPQTDLTSPPGTGLVSRRDIYRSDLHAAGRGALAVATHPVTVGGTKALVRNTWFVFSGAGVLIQRWRDTHGTSRYERQMRAAEAAGDQDRLLEWEARDVAEKQRRHGRVMDWVNAPLSWLRAAGVSALIALGMLVGLGVVLAIASRDVSLVIAPITTVIHTIAWVVTFVTVYGALLATLALGGAVVGLWALGRARTEVPAWVAPPGQRPVDEAVTPSKTVIALRDLGIPTLTRAIKRCEDAGGAMLSPIRIAGHGVEVDIRLPSGVTTSEIQARRRKLAENLDRHEHELFITIPARRTVRLWIAEPGALDQPIGPSPLVTDPDGIHADIYTGHAPWGQNLRGDRCSISLKQHHLLITGLSNQGKTAALRALALWAAFDPTTEFWIADLKGIGDWHMFTGLATELVEGPADEHVIAATVLLETAVAEMQRRLTTLDRDRFPDGVTRDLARAPGSGFHPLFVIVDEAQQAFMCPALDGDGNPYGGTKARSRYFTAARRLHNQGRAVNVTLWQGTQDPTDQNLPKLVREGAHIRASLVVGTEAQARMALGDTAVDAGAAPHRLRQGIDKGVLVCNGAGMNLPAGESSTILRTHYLSGDQAGDLAQQAKNLRATRSATSTPQDAQDVPKVDHLPVVIEVMAGARHLKRSDLLARLHDHDLPTYGAWEAKTLAAWLTETGVPAASIKGYPVVRLADLLTIQADRLLDTDHGDDSEDGEDGTESVTDSHEPD
ncbi:ATP-binding protein [Pseudonocardia sp. ICBG601]|uniref:ATP-binding protein n=1 Tax=Pseudonocardia sp. ICBG601 TaxID=2846759 RepID=UPI001CF68488|nr:ATP-binding protein [Pseudonocardia sp. ICBG601]